MFRLPSLETRVLSQHMRRRSSNNSEHRGERDRRGLVESELNVWRMRFL